MPGWPPPLDKTTPVHTSGGSVIPQTAVAVDMERTDGNDEVLLPLSIYDANGVRRPIVPDFSDNESEIVVDANGDNTFEMLGLNGSYMNPQGWLEPSGAAYYRLMPNNQSPYEFYDNPVVAADLAGSGTLQWLTAVESLSTGPNFTLRDLPNNSANKANYEWPMMGQNPAHTSRLITNQSNDTQPPTISITAPTAGASVSGTLNVVANASDNLAVARVDFLADGALVSSDTTSPYGFAWDTTGLSNGSHILTANAYDTSNNASSASSVVTVSNGDVTPPSTPTGLSATASAYNQVNLSWSASTDNVGVTGYYIVRGGVTIAQTTATTYSDTTVNASTAYSYQVMAYDAKGNTSGLSNSASLTTPAVPDTTPPSQPANLSASAISSSQINLSWSASSDNIGVASYDIYRNNTKIASVAGSSTSFGDAGLSASTTYSYFVIAKDATGNASPASSPTSATTQVASANGSINGTVSSSKGGVLAGVSVSVRFSGSNHSYTTDSAGRYSILGMPPGSFSVKYSKSGFTAQSQTVSVTAGTVTFKDVTLVSRK
jgi:chitodextrinase